MPDRVRDRQELKRGHGNDVGSGVNNEDRHEHGVILAWPTLDSDHEDIDQHQIDDDLNQHLQRDLPFNLGYVVVDIMKSDIGREEQDEHHDDVSVPCYILEDNEQVEDVVQ